MPEVKIKDDLILICVELTDTYMKNEINEFYNGEWNMIGSITHKWDGCSNIFLDEPYHVCGTKGLEEFKRLLDESMRMAAEHISLWDHEYA